MRAFTFYMTDCRYSVPTLTFEVLPDEASARRIAVKMLAASDHHILVEVWERDERLFMVPSPLFY